MERAKVVRGLRIAWSVWWGILCVLLIALWVRSYWVAETATYQFASPHAIAVASDRGQLSIESLYFNDTSTSFATDFAIDSMPLDSVDTNWMGRQFDWEVGRGADGGSYELHLPYWFVSLMFAMFAALPWIHESNRYSLRALFIATTLIAVLLGLVVIMRH
jgi:hypothetical protein